MNAAGLAATARQFTEIGISAGLTAQIASVVRTAGIEKVARLDAGIVTNPEAGAVISAYLADRVDSAAVARELALISDLQRFATLSFESAS